MKKLIYSILAVAFLALSSACQKESVEGDVCAVNYSVRVADAVATRASGQVQTAVNELVYEVYRTAGEQVESFTDADKLLYRGTAEIRNGVANFSLNHAKIHNLTVLFWAQVKVEEGQTPVYDVDDLTCVELNSAVGAGQNAEAFAGRDFVVKGKSINNGNVVLSRPVSQLKLATVSESLSLYGVPVNVTGSTLKVSGLSKTFDVAAMECGDVTDEEIVFTSASLPGEMITVGSVEYVCLAMNYLGFIPEGGTNVDVTYVFNADGVNVVNSVGNVPVKANYRTNIIGDLLTATSDYDVSMGDWGTGENKVIVVNTESELRTALTNVTGGERIVLAKDIVADSGFTCERLVNFTVDLNGKTITSTDCGKLFSFIGMAGQMSDKKIIVRNGNLVTGATALYVKSDMTIEFIDVNVQAVNSLISLERGNLIITGGIYNHTGVFDVTDEYGIKCISTANLLINSGRFESKNGLFKLHGGCLTINGGEFYGEVQSGTPDRSPLINYYSGELTVNGGTFMTKDGIVDYMTNNN